LFETLCSHCICIIDNLEVIQLKLLKDLAQISLPAYGDYLFASPMLISEEEKQMQENFYLFFDNLWLTAPLVTVTYNDKDEKEKRENHMIDIK
jgi:hypothetical protein